VEETVKNHRTGVVNLQQVAVITIAFFLGAAISGCAPHLEELRPVVNPALASAAPRTLAVLPVRLTVEADGDQHRFISRHASEDATARATALVEDALAWRLAALGYPTLQVAWDGTISNGGARRAAIPPEVLANLSDSLLAHGQLAAAGSAAPDDIGATIPFFPADATLHLGGIGHLKEDKPHRTVVAEQVGIGIAITVGIALLITIAVLAGRSAGSLLGGAFGGLGRAVEVATIPLRLGAVVALQSPRLAINFPVLVAASHAHGRGCNEWLAIHDGHPASLEGAPSLTRPGSPNFIQLTATLVDNRTGRVLWAAGQSMPIDPVDEKELRQAVDHLLARFPHAPRLLVPVARN
jgi:hypothetical protein